MNDYAEPPKTTCFNHELQALLNRYSKESKSNTPDYILATYLQDCLKAFNKAVNGREEWYGRRTFK
jgi:hypothetical protein